MSRVFLSPATLVGGSLVGAFLLAAWFGAFTRDEQPVTPAAAVRPATLPPEVDTAPRIAPALVPAAPAAPGPQAPAMGQVQSVSLAETCPAQALAAAQGSGDGRFALEAALASGAHVDPSAYVAVARESAQKGRLRDAEVALLAACHVAEKASGSQSVAVADLKSQMAQQYAALAAAQPPGGARDSLLQRASTLLSESAITYSAALGREASKTRLAEQRLASLRDPVTLQQARAELRSDPDTRVLGAAPRSAEEARTGPASRLISSDPELSQLERDIQRLHAQASSVTRDPDGLHRRDSQALAQRDAACQDKACLLRWYAQRRTQLLDEF
ncbi:hypothetical protein [Ramlibacter sp. AN1133]|uniref:hypothetical protein n=1 Tax=Ramlibacter sp. AN1133 TaxID=3133429 RepID=UPI0030BA8BC4